MIHLPFPQPSSSDGAQFNGQPTLPEGDWSANTAIVEALLDSPDKYQVKFEGTYWRAIAVLDSPNPAVGDTVAVVGREGNELIIQIVASLEPVPSVD